MIVPSWLAVAWYLPDFRLLASIGVGTALWILYRYAVVRGRIPTDFSGGLPIQY